MPSPYKEIPITFEKGLVTEISDSILDVGQASELQNWEPLPNGALQARNAWRTISTDGLPSSFDTRGWGTIATSVEGSPGGSGTTAIVQQALFPTTPNPLWFASSTSESAVSTKTLTLNGCVAGNLLVAFVGTDTSVLTDDPPTGFTEIVVGTGEGTNEAYVRIFKKVSTGGTESVTFTTGGVQIFGAALFELSGVETTVDDSAVAGYTGSGVGGSSITANPTSPDGGIAFGALTFSAGTNFEFTSFQGTSGFNESTDSEVYNAPGGGWFQLDATTYANAGTATASYAINNSTGSVKLVCFAANPSPPGPATPDSAEYYIVLAITHPTGYSVYRILRDEIETGTWELIDEVLDVTDTDALVSFAQGGGYLVWSSTTMTSPRSLLLSADPPTAADITDLTGKAGRTLAYHKDRLFSGGDTDDVSRLYFSTIGNPTDFTTLTDYLEVGGDDGEPIQDILSVEGLLLVCKSSRLYLISGSGIESFFVNELPGGSSASGRAAVRTPYGTIVAGVDDVWVVQGGSVDPLSRPLGAGYVIQGNAQTAYAQDSVLISDTTTRNVWRLNLVTGAWSTERVEGDDTVFTLFSLHGRLYYGTDSSVDEVGGTRKLSTARTYDLTSGANNFIASTGKLALLGPSVKYTPRWLFIQARNRDIASGANTLWVNIVSDNGETLKAMTVDSEVDRDRIDIPREHSGSSWIQITFSAGSAIDAGAIDPERIVLGVDVEAPR